MYYNIVVGIKGEEISAEYLIKKGYSILEKNYRSKYGEIDLITLDDKEIVFIEVKTRTNLKYGMPCEAVNNKKKKCIIRTAKQYIYINKYENLDIRFDIIEIYLSENKYKINHLKNVF